MRYPGDDSIHDPTVFRQYESPWPSQRMDWTEDALYTRQMVSPNKFATERTVSSGKWSSAFTGMVLAIMTSWKTPLLSLAVAGGLSTA